MILYGLLEPEWDFSAEAPNDVPRDFPALGDKVAQISIHQDFRPGWVYPSPGRFYESPRGPFWSIDPWNTPSEAWALIPANTVEYLSPKQPSNSGYTDPYVSSAWQYSGDFYAGSAPAGSIYTGAGDCE